MSRSLPCLQGWAHLIFSSWSSLQTTTGLVVIRSLAGVLPLLLACNCDSRWLVAQLSSSVNSRYFLKSSVCFSITSSGFDLHLVWVLDPDEPRYWVSRPRECDSSWRSPVGELVSALDHDCWFDSGSSWGCKLNRSCKVACCLSSCVAGMMWLSPYPSLGITRFVSFLVIGMSLFL